MADQDHRQQMLECEARYWIRHGYTTPEKVDALQELITQKRGAASARRLIDEMRRQWSRRHEWMEVAIA